MNIKHNIKTYTLILLLLMLGVAESVAGVAYNQIKDGGVYTIANFIRQSPGYTNYIWFNTTNSKAAYGPVPDAENSKWVAHKVSENIFCFENYSHSGVYLNMESEGISVSPYNYVLSAGHEGNTDYVTMQNGSTRYGGWFGAYDGATGTGAKYGFGKYGSGGCVSTQGTAQATSGNLWSTDWEFTLVGVDKQFFKDKVTYYNNNFSQLYSDDAKVTTIAAIDAASTLAEVETAMDNFYRSAEGIVVMFSNGSNNSKRYYIQQTTNTNISLTETPTSYSRFTLIYAGDGKYYVKSEDNVWYWGYLNSRNGTFGGTADTQWAGKWILKKAATANSTGDIVTLYCANSTTGYYYLHAASGPSL